MLGIVVSRADSASVRIGEALLSLADWSTDTDRTRPDAEGGGRVRRLSGVECREFEALHTELADVASAFERPDLLVFASRHAGETGALLTAHHTGNFGVGDLGGRDGELAAAAPNAHSRALSALAEYAPADYEVGMEGTHHGPTDLDVPSLFVELGSSDEQWNDPAGARAVARAILDLANTESYGERGLVGFGGGHYAPRFERIVGETDWTVGHVAPDWQLDAMNERADASENPDAIRRGVLQQALVRSRTTHALVEGDHPSVERVLQALDARIVSETWVRETTDVSLELVEWAENAITSVEDGLRFGAPARNRGGQSGEYPNTVETLPEDLLAEVRGIDAEETRRAVADNTLAFDTEEGGTQVAGRVALAGTEDRAAIVEALVDVLGERYETVERRDGAVVAHETAFDPEKARTLGVPEGPAFGKLANGETVCVGGEEIPPEVVHTERERRFSL